MKTKIRRSSTLLALSCLLWSCGMPDNKAVIPALQQSSQQQGPGIEFQQQNLVQTQDVTDIQALDYTFTLLKAPEFNVKKFLDGAREKPVLTLINNLVNPVNITQASNLRPNEVFALATQLSPSEEFAVTPHPNQAQTLNIKPLKFGAKAALTLRAGNETAFIDLESLPPQDPLTGKTLFLNALKDKNVLQLVHGRVTPVDLTAVEELKSEQIFALVTQVSPAGEFEVIPHPTQAQTLNIKPLKPNAKASLTLKAGQETVVLALEAIAPQTVALGSNLTLALPESLSMSKDEFREIKVEGIAPNQLVFIGFKNSNPGAFSVENPSDKPNTLRVKALKSGETSTVSVLVDQQRYEVNFSSVEAPQLETTIALSNPTHGSSFTTTANVQLVADIVNPIQGKCEVFFKDEAGALLTTTPLTTTSTQVTHLWKASDRDPLLEQTKIKASYVCKEPQKEINSELVEMSFDVPVKMTLTSPKGAFSVNPEQELTFEVEVGNVALKEDFTLELQRGGQVLQTLKKQGNQKLYTFKGITNPEGNRTDNPAEYQAVLKASTTEKTEVTKLASVISGGSSTPTPNGPPPAAPAAPVVIVGPSITSLSAASGTVGSSITINGTGFDTTPANNTVKFGATNATVTGATATTLTVTVPTLTAGAAYNVTATVGGQTNVGTNNYTVNTAITSLSVNNGCQGASIQVNGSGFDTTPANNIVKFGTIPATVTGATATQLTVTVPINLGLKGVNVQVGTSTSNSSNYTTNGGIHYVDAGAGGAGTGESWTNAFTSLSTALASTNTACSSEVWVKAGTYKPGAAKANTFLLKANFPVYGGFNGTETALGQRNFTTNVTILDGDVSGNDNTTIDDTEPTRSDNNYHVVTGASNSTIDGFTVQGGNADGASTFIDHGGGMINDSISNVTVKNIIFRNNSAKTRGSGMYNRMVNGLTVTDTTFTNNKGAIVGGGVANCPQNSTYTFQRVVFSGNAALVGGGMGDQCSGAGQVNVTDSVFSNNTATLNGAGYTIENSPTAILTNVVFTGNAAGSEGGALSMSNTSTTTPQNATLNNVTIFNNTAPAFSGAAIKTGGNPGCTNNLTINNSIVWSNDLRQLGAINNWVFNNSIITGLAGLTLTGNTNNVDSNPLFVGSGDPDGVDNIFRTADDGLQIGLGSPALDRGPGTPTTDITGANRDASADAGAYEKP